MSTSQFADSAFNGITLVHALFKLLVLLFAAPLLQKVVIPTYHDGSVSLSGGHTPSAADSLDNPFEAIPDFLTLGFLFVRPRLEPRTNPENFRG